MSTYSRWRLSIRKWYRWSRDFLPKPEMLTPIREMRTYKPIWLLSEPSTNRASIWCKDCTQRSWPNKWNSTTCSCSRKSIPRRWYRGPTTTTRTLKRSLTAPYLKKPQSCSLWQIAPQVRPSNSMPTKWSQTLRGWFQPLQRFKKMSIRR